MTDLDTSILDIRNENPPTIKWIESLILIRASSPAPYLMTMRLPTKKEVVHRAMWNTLDGSEVEAHSIPEKKVVLLYCTSKKLTNNNAVASAICQKPIFGSVAFLKFESDTDYASLEIAEFEQYFPEYLPSLDEIDELDNGKSRAEIISEFENDERWGEIICRLQFLRNKEGSNCSTIEIVRRVNEQAFAKFVLPELLQFEPRYWGTLDWDEYQKRYQRLTPFYITSLNSSLGKFSGGSLVDGTFHYRSAAYCIRVPSFDCPEAKLWAKIADSDISRRRAIELQEEIAQRLRMDQPLAPYRAKSQE
jgi:hypothetical protein